MKKIKFKSIASFEAGTGGSRKFFCALNQAALDYKYRDYKGLAVALESKDIMDNPVFSFKESDRISLGGKAFIDGKKLRELFVTSVFACYLDNAASFDNFEIKGKTIFIGYPETDQGIDTYISISRKAFPFLEKNKLTLGLAGKSSLFYQIQVKEYFNYKDFFAEIIQPRQFKLEHFKPGKLKSYDDVILIYIRSFTLIVFKDLIEAIENAGLNHKRIILIGMVAGAEIPNEFTFWDLQYDREFSTPIPHCGLFKTFDEMTGIKSK